MMNSIVMHLYVVYAIATLLVLISVVLLLRSRRKGPAIKGTTAFSGHRAPGLWQQLTAKIGGGSAVDETDRSNLRDLLLVSDFGTIAADHILHMVKSGGDLREQLEAAIESTLRPFVRDPDAVPPHGVVVLIGVNGSGKTTTIAKLARRWTIAERTVVLGAADTFRAAAADQLSSWGERLGVRVVRQRPGADPAAVAFDTVQAATRAHATAIIDTAGRLHGQENLINELKKLIRVVAKARPEAPDEIWLTLDASQGQTAIEQARRFAEAVDITGVIINKLDGEGRAGFVVRIAEELHIPIVGIGTGETWDDFYPFDPKSFAARIVEGDTDE